MALQTPVSQSGTTVIANLGETDDCLVADGVTLNTTAMYTIQGFAIKQSGAVDLTASNFLL